MRAKNSSYAWSLVNCKDSTSDSRFMIFNVLIQHWSFNIILFAKMSQLLDVHFPCQCRSLLLLLLLLLFFFLILSHLFWWLLEVMGNRQNIVFFLLFGWKWQCVHPFRWVFQDKAQSCYFPSLFLTFTNQSFEISTMYWSFCMLTFFFNLILRRGCKR